MHGGTSGIGITAIQIALAQGSKVFATAGSAEKCAAVEKLGATAINYREEDFAAVIAAATLKRGVDVVLDMVGAPYTERNLRSLAWQGRLVQVAFMQGSVVQNLDLLPVMTKRLTITGSTMRPRSTAEKGGDRQGAADLHLAAFGGRAFRAGGRSRVSAGTGGRGACADGEQRAYRQDRS